MAISRPILKETHALSMQDVIELSKRLLEECKGHDIPLVEQALIWSYLNVARGVHHFPKATLMDRALLVHTRALSYLVDQIIAVQAMSDAEVEAYCRTMDTSVM